MNQWIEEKDGKQYWYQQYSKAEMELLKKYRMAISRMTKLNFDRIMK
jgi:hypothetical protein